MKFRIKPLIVILSLFLFIIPAHASELSKLIEKADAAFHADDYETAAELYTQALEIDPTDYMAWLNLGFSLAELERYDESLKCYEKAVELGAPFVRALNPGDASELYDKAIENYENGDYEKALKYYIEALEKSPSNAMILYGIGWTHTRMGNSMKGENYFKKAIKANPLFKSSYYPLGARYYDRKESPGAPEKCIHFVSVYYLLSPEDEVVEYSRRMIEECQELLENQQ